MNQVLLYEEYRLIEKNEAAINKAWKGAHLLLFFMAFVFGSFCTFCFHMLMYLFDEKCVLFPKLLSLKSMRHDVIYEFIPIQGDLSDLPVDFLSTQWVDKSTCSLPTYVPLVSGIFGLVWTTMFLMCSTGSRTLTGLQRPWRVLVPVFVFSLAMGGLCIYSSTVTHYGLEELCIKLGEITGSTTCTYTVNVITLAYERRIRGVYQATRLTIMSAWLHTACWLCSALLAVVRILLVVDFQLVRVSAVLKADVDRLMERNETQVRTVTPDDLWINEAYESESENSNKYKYPSKPSRGDDIIVLLTRPSETLYSNTSKVSQLSLVPAESNKLARIAAFKKVPKHEKFIVKIVFDLIDNLSLPDSRSLSISSTTSTFSIDKDSREIIRQYGIQKIVSRGNKAQLKNQQHLQNVDSSKLSVTVDAQLIELHEHALTAPSEIALNILTGDEDLSSTHKNTHTIQKKSNLKNASAQTDADKKAGKRVVITRDVDDSSKQSSQDIISEVPNSEERKARLKNV